MTHAQILTYVATVGYWAVRWPDTTRISTKKGDAIAACKECFGTVARNMECKYIGATTRELNNDKTRREALNSTDGWEHPPVDTMDRPTTKQIWYKPDKLIMASPMDAFMEIGGKWYTVFGTEIQADSQGRYVMGREATPQELEELASQSLEKSVEKLEEIGDQLQGEMLLRDAVDFDKHGDPDHKLAPIVDVPPSGTNKVYAVLMRGELRALSCDLDKSKMDEYWRKIVEEIDEDIESSMHAAYVVIDDPGGDLREYIDAHFEDLFAAAQTKYPYKTGQLVTVHNAYLKDDKPLIVLGTIHERLKNGNYAVWTNNGDGDLTVSAHQNPLDPRAWYLRPITIGQFQHIMDYINSGGPSQS